MNKRYLFIAAGLTTLGALAGFGVKALADGIPSPNPLYYSGTLTEAGQLVNGMRAIGINLWPDMTTTGMPLCQTVASTTMVNGGRFRVQLDSSCKTAINQNANAYVEVIDGTTSLGRAPIGAVPYAVEADHAVSATTAVSATNAVSASAAAGTLATSIVSLQATQSNSGWALLHAAANGACTGLGPIDPGNNNELVIPKASGISCASTCAQQVAGNQTCRGEVSVGTIVVSQATAQKPIANSYLYTCDNTIGSGSEVGASSTDSSGQFSYCCCSGP